MYICSTSMEKRMDVLKPLSTTDEWGNVPYKMMRHPDAMGKEPDLIQFTEWEEKGLVRKHLGAAFDDKIRGHAFAAYVEEELQWMALEYEWEVLGFRRSIATIPGKGYARTASRWG